VIRESLGLLALVAVAGCVTEKDRFRLEATDELCSVESFAKQRDEVRLSINDWKRSIAPIQNNTGARAERRYSSALALLNQYDAEIEVGHQAIDQSCRIYARCLEVQKFNERKCVDTRDQYRESQERFAELLAYQGDVEDRVDLLLSAPININIDNTAKASSKAKVETTKKAVKINDPCAGWSWLESCPITVEQ